MYANLTVTTIRSLVQKLNWLRLFIKTILKLCWNIYMHTHIHTYTYTYIYIYTYIYTYTYCYFPSIPVSAINSLVWSWIGIGSFRTLSLCFELLFWKLFWNYYQTICISIHNMSVWSIPISINKFYDCRFNGNCWNLYD